MELPAKKPVASTFAFPLPVPPIPTIVTLPFDPTETLVMETPPTLLELEVTDELPPRPVIETGPLLAVIEIPVAADELMETPCVSASPVPPLPVMVT